MGTNRSRYCPAQGPAQPGISYINNWSSHVHRPGISPKPPHGNDVKNCRRSRLLYGIFPVYNMSYAVWAVVQIYYFRISSALRDFNVYYWYIHNGNSTEWSAIWTEIKRVITNCNHKFDFSPSLDKIFFFLAAGFPDQKFPANFFYKNEFWL